MKDLLEPFLFVGAFLLIIAVAVFITAIVL
jgi:hypothetical protein